MRYVYRLLALALAALMPKVKALPRLIQFSEHPFVKRGHAKVLDGGSAANPLTMLASKLALALTRIFRPALALGAIAALLFMLAPDPAAGETLLAYSIITNSSVDKIWRKVTGRLQPGFNFLVQEFGWMKKFKKLELDASLREMNWPTDLLEDGNVTMLDEGGREAEPSSVNAVDATGVFVHANGRFTVAKRARWASEADGGAGTIEKQLKFQGKKKMQAVARILSNQFYGYSTGYLCQTSTNATQASGTYTLKNAFGDSAITNAAYIANLFRVGDKVALVRSGALVTNAIGTVTAVTAATPSIAVTWAGSVDSDDNDYVVPAAGANASTIAHTSYNRALVGLRDMHKTDSVHNIASSAQPNWSVCYSDTSAGRFNGQKYRKALDAMQNDGDPNASPMVLMAQGVRRDVTAQYAAGVRFSDTMDLEIDGEPKAGGKKFKGTKLVPPGMVMMFDQNKALRVKTIFDNTEETPSWGGGKELVDDSGWIFAIEWSGLMATTNRKLHAYFENQTEL